MKKIKNISLITITPLLTFGLISCRSNSNIRNIEENQNIFFNFPILNLDNSVSKSAIKLLNKKLNNRMLFGPEAMILKKIKIFKDANSDIKEGMFDGKKNEIIINVNIPFKNSIINDYDLAEYIFQISSHEYKHFLAHTYLNSITDKTLSTNNIFLDGYQQKWPLYYVNEFKRLLKYQLNTPKYSSDKIASNFVSLGSVYNQKELFDIANSQQGNFKLQGNEVMAPLKPEVPIDNAHVISNNSLKYIYSMEELYARKNQLATENIFVTKKNKYGLDKDGWFITKNSKYWSPYLQDVVNFRKNLQTNEGQYLNDNPLGENRSDLIKLFKQSINYGEEGLTFLDFSKDEFHISIGGQTNINFKPIKLVIQSLKQSLKYDLNTFFKDQNYWSALNIPIQEVINKNLLLEDKSGHQIAISHLKNSKYGVPTTFRFYKENLKNYKCKIVNDIVRITTV